MPKNESIGIKELAALVAEKMDWSQKDAKAAIDATIEAITDTCKGGKDVKLVGFATFSNVFVEAHEARNPATSGTVHVPDKNVFKIKAAKGVDMTPPKPAAKGRRNR